jgi:iron complex transport system substrate-binding protein
MPDKPSSHAKRAIVAIKNIVTLALFAVASLPGWATSATAASAFQVTDDRGVVVTFERAPQRIVSLLPSLSETVCALGQCARLVAVDRYSNHPPQLQKLPQMGGGLDPAIEAVVAQKPDVVLLATSSRAALRLESLGIKVVALEPKTHAQMRSVLERVAHVLQVPDAQAIWSAIDVAIAADAQALPASVKAARVFFPVSNAPHGAGEASFIGETLARLGAKNIVPSDMGVFPKLNPEFVVRANPDVIIASDETARDMFKRPGWQRIRAIRENRVCRFTPAQVDVLVRPGPRMAEGARMMAACLRDKAP